MTRMSKQKQYSSLVSQCICVFFAATIFWILTLCLLPELSAADFSPPEADKDRKESADRSSATLDDTTLRTGIALRLRTARGVKDERFRQMTADHVFVEKKVPVQAGSLTVFAVKLRIIPPVPDSSPEFITLVVDETGTLQFGGIQELANGTSLVKEAVEQLQDVNINDLPADFGKTIYSGTGPHTVIVISDPFCPHCRRGWEFIKTNLDRIRTLRLAHFPLSPAAETAGLVMADAYHRESMVFEIIDFTYTFLDSSGDPLKILAQYRDEFPETAEKWGTTPEDALTYLKEKYLPDIKTEQHVIRSLGIHSTPIFFVNQTFIKGFNSQKMESAMQ